MSGISWPTVGLLTLSNLFMTFAWYGHLKNLKDAPLIQVILISWGIAFLEYMVQVPANRIGSRTMTLDQLKITQEAISLLVFLPFSVFYMKQHLSWNYAAASICILAAVFFIFWKTPEKGKNISSPRMEQLTSTSSGIPVIPAPSSPGKRNRQ